MNKTLLLFIVDFLFLNLIALTRWERAEPVRAAQPPVPEVAANAASRTDDLVEAMRQSLAEEQSERQDLAQKLAYASDQLAAREQSVSALQSERTRLSASLADTERAEAELGQRIQAATRQASLTEDQLAQLKRDLAEKAAEAAREHARATALEAAQADAARKIQDLTMAVVVSGAENQQLEQQTATLQTQVQAERAERIKVEQASAQLAQGVGRLAQNSGALTQEIRQNRPISANVLFSDFLANQVQTTFTASRKGLFGMVDRSKAVPTVFTTDGRQVYALVEVDDTVLSFDPAGYDWSKVGVAFDRPASGFHADASALEFLRLDPRVVAVPVDPTIAAGLGVKVYALSSDPFRFSDAVLISARGKGYGTVGFKLDPEHPGYVRVDSQLFKRIFGDFAPSRGDLVLSQSGELIGVMVNGRYCALVRDFTPVATIRTGDDTLGQHTGAVLDGLGAQVRALPFDLQ
jgi:hypothetical protein